VTCCRQRRRTVYLRADMQPGSTGPTRVSRRSGSPRSGPPVAHRDDCFLRPCVSSVVRRSAPVVVARSRSRPARAPLQTRAMTLQLINPADLPPQATYTQVVVAAGTTTVFIAGQEPEDVHGNSVGPGDLAAQARQVYANLGRALAAAGGALIRSPRSPFTSWTTNPGTCRSSSKPGWRCSGIVDRGSSPLGAHLNPGWDPAYAHERIARPGLDVKQKAGKLSAVSAPSSRSPWRSPNGHPLLLLDEPGGQETRCSPP
jgi:hypothetical protein